MDKFKSILKKGSTLAKVGVEPYLIGKENYENNIEEFELKAKRRIFVCKSCPFYQEEPIDFLKVKDERIKEANNMFCNDCGCSLPYKIRQDAQKCEKWQEL